MEEDILDCLDDLGYPVSLESNIFDKALEQGPKSPEFTKIVEWLSKELQVLINLESCVNAVSTADDASSFLLELSSFLKEMNCPYQCLLKGNVSQRLATRQNRVILLDFLCTELEAARMLYVKKPNKKMQVEMQETPTAACVKSMLISLKFAKPPQNITSKQLFDKVESKIKEIISKLPAKILSSPLFTGKLSDKQWVILTNVQEAMHKEYFTRRETLLKRLDVTIKSFEWGDKYKGKEKQIQDAFLAVRQLLILEPNISLSDLLVAREDISVIEKTSNSSVRANTQCAKVNKCVIGSVPDRGGRPEEQQPPPPEMPSWQKRNDQSKGGFSNTSAGDQRGGGRVQGAGWSSNTNYSGDGRNQGSNWQDNRSGSNWQNSSQGGYQGRGGYHSSGQQVNYAQANYQGGYQGGGGQHGGGYQGGGQHGGGYHSSGQQSGGYHGGYNEGYQGGQGKHQYSQNENQHSRRGGGHFAGNDGYQQGGGNRGRYQQDGKENWHQGRGEYRGGRGGGRGGHGGRGGSRNDNQTQPVGAMFGYPVYDPTMYQGQYQQYNQYQGQQQYNQYQGQPHHRY